MMSKEFKICNPALKPALSTQYLNYDEKKPLKNTSLLVNFFKNAPCTSIVNRECIELLPFLSRVKARTFELLGTLNCLGVL